MMQIEHLKYMQGTTYPVIRDQCVPLAELIKRWSDKLGKVGPAQIYKGTLQGNDSDYDRDVYDGAIRRSESLFFSSTWISFDTY